MKKILIISIVIISLLAGCSKYTQDAITAPCELPTGIGNTYAKKDTLEKIMQQYIKLGIPGLAIAVYTPTEGYWGTATGFAKIETKIPMQLCHLQYLQSVSKTYMAAAILKLYEEGKIDLDAPVTQYLPEKYSHYIDKASTMSIRNLLNHTSGMPDYLESPVYITYVLQHPDHFFTSDEILGYIKNKKQEFTPGTKFRYSNTNFHVLTLIADAIAGDHNELIRQKILKPLGLTNTFYRQIIGHPTLVNSYMDRFSTGIVENVSQLQQVSITFSKGDDGIIATPIDAINFMSGLMEGKLLSQNSFNQMITFVKDAEGNPAYGMGIYYVTYSGKNGYGHGGAGAGAGCGLYYFPDKKIYVFMGTNIGTLIDGPLAKRANELKNKLLEIILKD
jgi:D-alanyl-D-alanine carboxypeptidase